MKIAGAVSFINLVMMGCGFERGSVERAGVQFVMQSGGSTKLPDGHWII